MGAPANLYLVATLLGAAFSGIFLPRLGFAAIFVFILADIFAGRYA